MIMQISKLRYLRSDIQHTFRYISRSLIDIHLISIYTEIFLILCTIFKREETIALYTNQSDSESESLDDKSGALGAVSVSGRAAARPSSSCSTDERNGFLHSQFASLQSAACLQVWPTPHSLHQTSQTVDLSCRTVRNISDLPSAFLKLEGLNCLSPFSFV